MILIINDTD